MSISIEQPAVVSSHSGVPYKLPEAKEMHNAWTRCEARGFIPSENQKLVIAVVKAALDSGLFYTTDVRSFCAKAMGLTSEQDAANFQPARVEGGVFGMECYYARKYLDAMSRFAREDKAHAQLKPHVGQKLGTIMFNDFKRSTGAVVSEVKDNVITLHFKRGKVLLGAEVSALVIKNAIDRAAEKQLRRDTFDQFTAPAALAPAPQSAETEPSLF